MALLTELTDQELRAMLVGRTVVAIEIDHVEGDWKQGDGETTLVLDDGRRIQFRSWGYDAWGLNAYTDEPST
jgi:agmatine/peptidylarginine deiminase